VLFLAKKQKVCYAFLFAGLTGAAPEASRSKMEKKDAIDLGLLAGAKDGGGIFYLNRS
jgi:hypothetical protein